MAMTVVEKGRECPGAWWWLALPRRSMGAIGVPVLMVPMLLCGHLGGSGRRQQKLANEFALKRLGSACTVGSNLFDRWRTGGRMNLALRNGAQAPIVHRHSSSP